MKNGTGKYQYSIRAAQANRKPQTIANDQSTLANAPKLPLNDDLNTLFRQTNPVSTLCWYGWQYTSIMIGGSSYAGYACMYGTDNSSNPSVYF
jgi:hypothetical protein